MKEIIKLDKSVDFHEFCKAITFISEDIQNFSFNNETNELTIEVDQQADIKSLSDNILKISKRYKHRSKEEEKIFAASYPYKYHQIDYDNEDIFISFSQGMIGLKGVAIFLYDFFDAQFEAIALKLNAELKKYPVLLPIDKYKKTGYLHNSPQYSMFCCSASENMNILENLENNILSDEAFKSVNKPQFALSPSACFHTYIEYENKTLEESSVFSFVQSVFRNEGRLNFNELGRLRDYHVREIVFAGDNQFVSSKRKEAIEETIKVLKNLKLSCEISTASDPFVLPKMQKYKTIQLLDNSKYELRLNLSSDKQISTASFNLHGTAFTYPFNIGVSGVEEAVTGCVGFGLERWVIAFLCQFGTNPDNWPETVRKVWRDNDAKIRK